MISKLLEISLALTSISPIFLSIGLYELFKLNNIICFLFWILLFILSVILCFAIIKFSQRKLEVLPIKIKSIAPADREIAAFIIAYILPLLDIVVLQLWKIIFIIILLFWCMLATSNYHFNPVLSLFCYHYYEVEIEESNGENATYVLMTKRTIKNVKNIRKVVQVSDYMLMEVNL